MIENPVTPPQTLPQPKPVPTLEATTAPKWQVFLNQLKKNPKKLLLFSALVVFLILAGIIFNQSTQIANNPLMSVESERVAKPSFISQVKEAFSKLGKLNQIANVQPSSTPTPSASPIPLTPGPGVYNVSQGKHTGPTINQVTFDPLDIQVGDPLKITLRVLASTPANTITATLETDNSTEQLTFTKESSDDDYETWTTDLTLPHPVLYKYILTVTSSSINGSSEIIVAPRS